MNAEQHAAQFARDPLELAAYEVVRVDLPEGVLVVRNVGATSLSIALEPADGGDPHVLVQAKGGGDIVSLSTLAMQALRAWSVSEASE